MSYAKNYRDKSWPKGLVQRGYYFHYQRTFKGRAHRHSLETSDLNHAIKLAIEYNEKIEDKKISPDLAIKGDGYTLLKAGESYLQLHITKKATLAAFTHYLDIFCEVLPKLLGKPEVKLIDIKRQIIEEFVLDRKKQLGLSDKTLNNYIVFLKSILKYAVEKEWLLKVPNLSRIVTVKKNSNTAVKGMRPLTREEVNSLLAAAQEYDKKYIGKYVYDNFFESVLRVYLYTGLRLKELQFLEWDDIYFNKESYLNVRTKNTYCHRTIKLKPESWDFVSKYINPDKNKIAFADVTAKTLNKIGYKLHIHDNDILLQIKGKDFDDKNLILDFVQDVFWHPKGSEGEVSISPKLKELLLNLKARSTSNFVFADKNGAYWNFKNNLLSNFDKIVKLSGIRGKKPRIHDLRHTFATLLRRKGVGIETLQKLLRHADINDTLKYAAYCNNEGFKAVALLDF